jgi:uncharacterized membrane protein YraQ (UPF0718 family)
MQGFRDGGSLFLTILPNLVIGFILAGMVGILVPKEIVARWLGEKSGWMGLMTGTFLGAVTPGGPFSQFPLVASMWKVGASPGPLAAYLTAWALLGFNRVIVFEWPFMGPTFTMIHLGVCLFVPPLVGLAVNQVYKFVV